MANPEESNASIHGQPASPPRSRRPRGLSASLIGGHLEAAPRFGAGGYRYGGGSTPYHFNNTGFRSGYQGYHTM